MTAAGGVSARQACFDNSLCAAQFLQAKLACMLAAVCCTFRTVHQGCGAPAQRDMAAYAASPLFYAQHATLLACVSQYDPPISVWATAALGQLLSVVTCALCHATDCRQRDNATIWLGQRLLPAHKRHQDPLGNPTARGALQLPDTVWVTDCSAGSDVAKVDLG